MKTLTASEAQGQIAKLIAEANEGEVIILKDGDKQATLSCLPVFGVDEDSPELAAELMKAAKGPFTPYARQDLESVADQVLREKKQ